MIRVLLVEDQTLVRQGLRALLGLSGDLQIVAEAEDGEQALDALRQHRPDVTLMDIRMPRLSGVDVLRELHASGQPVPKVILLTTFDDDAALLEGMRHGARGYLLKDVSLEQLTDAIRQVAAGGVMIRPAVTDRAVRGAREAPVTFEALDRPDPLSHREVEILRLLAGGYSNREIAHALGTAEGTVKNQVSSILSKLGVRDRTRAVLKALELGHL